MQLQNYEEIIGILDKLELNKNQDVITLVFTFKKKIDLPLDVCDKNLLVSSLGKKIAVLRIDNDIKIKTIENEQSEVWLVLLKTIGCKIPAELYLKINYEICKIGKTKSEFLRMLINNYFKQSKSDENIKVNVSETQVNHIFNEDEYQT